MDPVIEIPSSQDEGEDADAERQSYEKPDASQQAHHLAQVPMAKQWTEN